jgi:hypothetical protein
MVINLELMEDLSRKKDMTAIAEPKITKPWMEEVLMRRKIVTPETNTVVINTALEFLNLSE